MDSKVFKSNVAIRFMHNQTKDGFQSPKIISIIYYVFAVILMILAVALIVLGIVALFLFFAGARSHAGADDFAFGGMGAGILLVCVLIFGIVFGVVFSALSIIMFIAARGLARVENRARFMAIISSAILSVIMVLFAVFLPFIWVRFILGFLILVHVVLAIFLLFVKFSISR